MDTLQPGPFVFSGGTLIASFPGHMGTRLAHWIDTLSLDVELLSDY